MSYVQGLAGASLALGKFPVEVNEWIPEPSVLPERFVAITSALDAAAFDQPAYAPAVERIIVDTPQPWLFPLDR